MSTLKSYDEFRATSPHKQRRDVGIPSLWTTRPYEYIHINTMHYGYPTRKSSHPPAFAAKTSPSSIIATLQRIRPRSLAIITGAVILFFWLVAKLFGSSTSNSNDAQPIFTKAPSGSPNVVIVTTLNNHGDGSFNDALVRNRKNYAAKHGMLN